MGRGIRVLRDLGSDEYGSAVPSPCRLVCLHGAGTDARAFSGWAEDLSEFEVVTPDFQIGHDPSCASMDDYVAVALAAAEGAATAVLCGWSMGGLVALMAAQHRRMSAVVVLEPSLPSELGGTDAAVTPMPGAYHPDDVYGPSLDGPPTRLESRLALDERRRGISVHGVDAPLLVVAGSSYPVDRGSAVAEYYGGALLTFPALPHAALVRDPAVRHGIAAWIIKSVG